MIQNDIDATRLKLFGLPMFSNLSEFSVLIHLSEKTLFKYSRFADRYYKTITIPKSNGQPRIIHQPSRKLKAIQRWILRNILVKLKVSQHCKGFVPGSNIKQNASAHIGSNALLSLDLEDFFTTISAWRVYGLFRTIGYNSSASKILTNMCCYRGYLPQGSPCSPQLSNLVVRKLDDALQSLIGEKDIIYTRYADDLSFSAHTPQILLEAKKTIEHTITRHGFRLNRMKTRISGYKRQKRVTGLIVTEEKAGIGRNKLRLYRSKIQHLILKNITTLGATFGHLAFIYSVDISRFQQIRKYIEKLDSKYANLCSKQLVAFCIKLHSKKHTA